ncbi:MAG: N-6 DNA methylase [Bacteroidota bacterium]
MNPKDLISALGYAPKEGAIGIYSKKYDSCQIEVDFEKREIDYGNKIKYDSKTTQNFIQKENWVVLECIDRLLLKGYPPENIILEKTWPSGHGTSGRLDICVTRDDGSEYALIECKTYGKELDKAVQKLHKNGGQLFTYFKFSNKADVVMLYASELNKNIIQYKNEIVKIDEAYRTGDVKDFFEKWSKLTNDNGFFDSWVQPYEFETKALTLRDLKPIQQEDSSFIFNRFLEILRHNVVSDKPNAFNKIFTLFLCKVYDEKSTKKDDELKFQWLEGQDDDVSFQVRLTDLYKKGMMEFLEKEVTDFSDEDFEGKFQYLDEKVKKALKDEIIKLRLEKNNEFAIKEVFDHQSFKENAKIVKEVVELLQGFRLRYNKRQQYLSDFFELLLTTGLKQESGQYFTPVPIAQFIIKSLPIDKLVNEKLEKGEQNNLLPYIMDYAAGSGHFLTESMHEIQRIIDKKDASNFIDATGRKLKSWQGDHFDWATKYVYGIEKDYRLVKVGKVGCYLHGDGLANVILSDGLANFKNTKEYKGLLKHVDADFPRENKQFDIVISNPPYSVSAFKGASTDYYSKQDFELYDSLTDTSSEIECLFIERTKQLLKDGGLAGIILPSSILSNSGIYAKARGIIFEYFDIVGMTELGSNTFMETNTNTVTLFLRRRNNYVIKNLKAGVEKILKNFHDITLNGVEKPLSKYVNHAWEGVKIDDYNTLLKKSPNESVLQHEIYTEYQKKIKTKDEGEFWQKLLDTEKEKLLYFILAYPQQVVVVKSGSKNEEKRFLGYEFSKRRGSEGIHPIQRGKNIEDCTQLFDPEVFDNPQRASTYIYKAFEGECDTEIHESLQKNIARHSLVDMLTFDRAEFENTASLHVKKKVSHNNRFPLSSLEDISKFQSGLWKGEKKPLETVKVLRNTNFKLNNGKLSYDDVAEIEVEQRQLQERTLKFGDIILEKSGGSDTQAIGRVVFFDRTSEKYSYSNFCSRIRVKDENIVNPIYLWLILHRFYQNGGTVALQNGVRLLNIDLEGYKKIKIPLPPTNVQEKIVAEIQVFEETDMNVTKKIKELRQKITEIIESVQAKNVSLAAISSFKNGLNYSRNSIGEVIDVVGVGDFLNRFSVDKTATQKVQIDGSLSDDYLLKDGDILVVRSNGSVNLVGRFVFVEDIGPKTSYSGFTIRIRPDIEKVNSRYICHYLKTQKVRDALVFDSKGSNIKSLNQGMLSSIKVPLPPNETQQKIVAEIEAIEKEIAILEKKAANIPAEKEAVFKKYL